MTLALATAASGVARDRNFALNPVTGLYERALLLEPAFTNLVSSDNFDSGWTSDGSPAPTITTGISDPAGGTSAYEIEDASGSVEGKYLDVTFTGDAQKAVVFIVAEGTMPASGVQRLQLYDNTAASDVLTLDITAWSAGEPTITATTGTLLGKLELGGGFWAVYGLSATVTAANTNRLRIYPANTAAETGSIVIYRAHAFNATVPPVSAMAASDTKAADVAYAATGFNWTPQQATGYYRFVEAGGVGISGGVVAHGGSSTAGEDPRVVIQSNGTYYQAIHDNGTTVSTSTAATAPSFGDLVELRVSLGSDGAIQLHQTINEGTEADATAGAAATLAAAWAGTRHYLGSEAGTNGGIVQLTHAAWYEGDISLASLRAVCGVKP